MVKHISLILLVLLTSSAKSQTLPKVYDIDYRDGQTLKMYAGGKATLRFNSVNYDADAVQLSFASDNIDAAGVILGPRSVEVIRGAGSNYVEFNVELPELKANDLYKKFKINIRAFKKSSDLGYEMIEKIENSISPISCASQKEEPVCALVKTRCSLKGCIEDEKEQVFSNECEMDKHGASYLHHGLCQQ